MNSLLPGLFEKARRSSFWCRVLSSVLNQAIPFNAPHGLRIAELTETSIGVVLPYRRRNRNHVRGLHACALATAAEFASGVLLLSKLDARQYRIIMHSLRIEYVYQGKKDAHAHVNLEDTWFLEQVVTPLKTQDSVEVELDAEVYDSDKQHLCTGRIRWQIKNWRSVATPV